MVFAHGGVCETRGKTTREAGMARDRNRTSVLDVWEKMISVSVL